MSQAAHKIELRPNQSQAATMRQNCGLARYAYNWALRAYTAQYECRRKHIAWLCQDHGVLTHIEERDGRSKRRPEKDLLADLSGKGVTDPILPMRPDINTISRRWTLLKPDWAEDLYADAALQAIRNLGTAVKNFFDRLKKGQGGRKAGFPRPKRRDIHDSYAAAPRKSNTTYRENGTVLSCVRDRRVKLPKIGWVRMAESLRFSGTVCSITVSRRAHKWFASILVEVDSKVSGTEKNKQAKWGKPAVKFEPLPRSDAAVGVDLGISHAIALSDGTTHDGPMPLRQALRKLRRMQRSFSRMRTAATGKQPSRHDPTRAASAARKKARRDARYLEKLARRHGCTPEDMKERHDTANRAKRNRRGNADAPKRGPCKLRDAKNYRKQKLRIARLHYRISCVRENWLQERTTRLIRDHGTICIEDLNVSGMLANEKLARSIADIGMFEFRRQLVYKAKSYGRKVVTADRFFPSSKLCSKCDFKYEGLALHERAWKCPQCDTNHDRDVNAALNLLRVGTGMYPGIDAELSKKSPAETGIRRSKTRSLTSSRSKKQESDRLTAEG
ncbi:MAG: transposase, partial [Planctomycetes bacterium]|nr:transposase [Planctomycetota bacterium]